MSNSNIKLNQLLHCTPEELELYLPTEVEAEWLVEYVHTQQQKAKEELAEEFALAIENYLLRNTDFEADYDTVAKYLAGNGDNHLAKLLSDLGVD